MSVLLQEEKQAVVIVTDQKRKLHDQEFPCQVRFIKVEVYLNLLRGCEDNEWNIRGDPGSDSKLKPARWIQVIAKRNVNLDGWGFEEKRTKTGNRWLSGDNERLFDTVDRRERAVTESSDSRPT